jgi:NAD+ synthase
LNLDANAEVARIRARLKEALVSDLNRRGYVIAMSGGIDSSLCAALCVAAIGPQRVFGLLLPERDSSDESAKRGQLLAKHLGIRFEAFDIAPTLEAIGCYRYRDAAIRRTFPGYDGTWRNKIVIDGGLDGRINRFSLVVERPDGAQVSRRLDLHEYLEIVAATNFKQRIRKTVEYFYADRLNYAVVGTPNRLEFDQGFFVKNGDGSADVKPIAHLYKTQVYALASFLNLPQEILDSIPTTDTYSLMQGQDEFFFALPYDKMDIAIWALNHGHTAEELAETIDVTVSVAERIFADIRTKRRTTRYLHATSVLVESVTEHRLR